MPYVATHPLGTTRRSSVKRILLSSRRAFNVSLSWGAVENSKPGALVRFPEQGPPQNLAVIRPEASKKLHTT